MSTTIYLLPRLNKIPKIYRLWQNILSRYSEDIHNSIISDKYANEAERLEAEVICLITRATIEFGSYNGEVSGYHSDFGDVAVDGALAEGLINEVFNGAVVEIQNGYNFLDLDLTSLVRNLRRHLYQHVHPSRFIEYDGKLYAKRVVSISPGVPHGPNGDWMVCVEFEEVDTGLVVTPTLDEFRMLMFYWQAKHGSLVGHANSEEAAEEGATYIGRLTEKYAGSELEMPQICMGNPYSSLSNRPFQYIDTGGVRHSLMLKGKLEACYAYYIKSISDLIEHGNEDDYRSSHRHWARFYNLHERLLACHCSNFSNKRSESRFCHGLVIAGIAECLY